MRIGCIYKITIADEFIYGSSIHTRKRKNHHLSQLRNNKHVNTTLQNKFNKYKESMLSFEIVQDNIPEDVIEDVENIWIGANCGKIQDDKGGLNILDGCRRIFTKEDKLLMSNILKESFNNQTEDIKERKRAQLRKAYNDNKTKIGLKIRNTFKDNPILPWHNKNSKPILQITLEGNPIKLWGAGRQAEKEANYSSAIINLVCNGLYYKKQYANYIWRFATPEDINIFYYLKDVIAPFHKKRMAAKKSTKPSK